MKKILLFLSLFSVSTNHAFSLYPLLSTLGSGADMVISRGKLSEKHDKMFQKIAASLGIEHRNIQARNSGLLIRLGVGYQNAISYPKINRVYFNEDFLNELSDEQKKFIMAHELTHHSKNHIWKRILFSFIFLGWFKDVTIDIAKKQMGKKLSIDKFNTIKNSYLYRYLTDGFVIPATLTLSIWGLIEAQLHQSQETEADTNAILQANVHPKDGIGWVAAVHYPNTDNWPFYAKITPAINRVELPILSLPILKQHMPHLASFNDRVKHLKQLEPEWQKRYGNKSSEAITA